MSSVKPIKLYGHERGPNPYKVIIILEELGVPYDYEVVPSGANKQEPFLSVNPNGRVPAITDPNTGITLWESGAIIEYLLDTYDKDNKLSYTSFPEKYHQSQWKHFQVSGQGPYFGQKAWFTFFHEDKNITSAIERYAAEVRRVLSVIELHFSKTGKEYLVGDKVTFADLMWITWNELAQGFIMGPEFAAEWEKNYPKTWAWHQKLLQRDAVKAMNKKREEVVKAGQS